MAGMAGRAGMMENKNDPQFDASKQEKTPAPDQPAGQTGITAGSILNDAEKFIKNAKEAKAQKKSTAATVAAVTAEGNEVKSNKENPFPTDAFPEPIQQIIRETNKCLSFPTDFIGASLLSAAGVVIGNTHKVQAKRTWLEGPVLYIALVGKPGTNKSHPLSFAFEPIRKNDNKSYKEYRELKKKYDSLMKLSKKDRKEQGFIEDPPKPVWKKFLVSDITPESLAEVHSFNIRGIGLYSDELAGWLNNFNRYSSGSEEQFWLSAWSGKAVVIDRKTSGSILINSPAISVVGTIQTGILKELVGNSRSLNGFNDRILFAFPDRIEMPHWSDVELDELVIENWHEIVSRLLELPTKFNEEGNVKSDILQLHPDARKLFILWFDRNVDLSSGTEDEARRGIYAKLSQYTLRFALILELLRWACRESDGRAIGIEAVSGAIKLIEYFRKTALKVHEVVSDPLKQLPADKQNLYESLPDIFTTAEGLKIALDLSTPIPADTYNKFLRNYSKKGPGMLFTKLRRGEYEKLV